MQLTQSTMMRQDMRQLLTPRMIQSMEILQLPLMALEERIEQELQNNPVLELKEGETDPGPQITEDAPPTAEDRAEGEQALVVKEDSGGAEDFERLSRIADYLENEEFHTNSGSEFRSSASYDGERDKKLDAMNNTAARGITLQEHLLGEWAFVECSPRVRQAGRAIIASIEDDGYLRTSLETIQQESKNPLSMDDLHKALALVQTLEPAGVGARTPRECLLLQLDAIEADDEAAEGHDFDLERKLINDHLKDLEMNRYPLICKKLGRDIEDIKAAVRRLSRLHPHPGKLIGGEDSPAIHPDAVIYLDEQTDKYEIEMANDSVPSLFISGMYRKMIKDRSVDKKTREFLTNNVRNARWLIESIEQRKSTIMRVIRVAVDAQREFFDKGPEFLKPLPMIQVADQLGIHVATVSRAVSEKWIQTPRGVFPLRKFFSGGTTNDEGEDMSWDAVKEKLRVVIDHEDRKNPLNDDEIVAKMKEQGIDLARRTVAKYRKILNIPTARQRREF
ncbi:MAG: RNA polymerase factor sigma-54 [Phycisphaerales bacterium]|jgi:RNA polymerase sigma-54 factor|nr:RNA polymerase factor sigma-54 [Phycisphaerales bacterium]